MRTIALIKIWNRNKVYLWEIFSCFYRIMDFYVTASPNPLPCIEIISFTWQVVPGAGCIKGGFKWRVSKNITKT